MRRLLPAFILLCLCIHLNAQTPGPTDGYPIRYDRYLNDNADILSDSEEADLRALIREISGHFDLTVLTISSISAYDAADPSIETFSTRLFNQWGIGTRARNTGVLIVVAVADRETRIELGDDYGRAYDNEMKVVISEYILPSFRKEDYAQGLLTGTSRIYQVITGQLPGTPIPNDWEPAASPFTDPSPSSNSVSTSDDDDLPVPLIAGAGGLAGVLGLGYVGVRRYQRLRPRKCPNCSTQMVRLDETADDAFLQAGQQQEERLGSVDYDVWECPTCHTRETFDYNNLFSQYSACPQCKYRTLSRVSTVVSAATTYSTGRRRIDLKCNNCSYHDTREEVIPMVVKSTSSHRSSSRGFSGGSSGGSSGGGSSSGGGASGSW